MMDDDDVMAARQKHIEAMNAFLRDNKKALRSIANWAKHSGCAANTLGDFLKNKRDSHLDGKTMIKLAHGASALIKRDVSVAELLGEALPSDIRRIVDLIRLLPADQQDLEIGGILHRLRKLTADD
ncbi:hypothetical protein [Azospirillum sp. B4]|uniref:hypothetical protein n=1 Tax=Azospirillum sp. B4 TaxID=95605 RepID=UPI0011DCDC49|nr:hypothetical protein [Azospirillum sp. B4]